MIQIAFPYKLRNCQRQIGSLRTAHGRTRAWAALKTSARLARGPWRRVLKTRVADEVLTSTRITVLEPPYEW